MVGITPPYVSVQVISSLTLQIIGTRETHYWGTVSVFSHSLSPLWPFAKTLWAELHIDIYVLVWDSRRGSRVALGWWHPSLDYYNTDSSNKISPRSVQDLNRLLLTRVNHTGSDIRISTGEILNPKAHPRQGVQADWWEWKPSFRLKWNKKEHINALELRSIFLAVRYHVTHLGNTQFRIFHLTDSYICMSILGKGPLRK